MFGKCYGCSDKNVWNTQQVLLSSNQHTQKGTDYDSLKPWLKEGLLLSSGTHVFYNYE